MEEAFTIEFEKVLPKITMRLYSNGIFHYKLHPNTSVLIEDVDEILKFVKELGEERLYLNLYEFTENADVDVEVRNWAADSGGNKQTIADAIVIKSLAHKILGNFYLNFHKPVKPTRLFMKKGEAIHWLLKNKGQKKS